MTRLALAALLSASALAASPALAEEEKLPVRFVDRPLTLPRRVLMPELDLQYSHVEYVQTTAASILENLFFPSLGASYGVVDDLTLHVEPLSLVAGVTKLDDSALTTVKYDLFRLGATYRFLRSAHVEIGARAGLAVSGAGDAVYLSWGLPVVLRVPHVLRIDTGFTFMATLPTKSLSPIVLDIALASNDTVNPLVPDHSMPGVPVDLTVQIVPELFAGIDTGLEITSFRGPVFRCCAMPLGFHAGGTLPAGTRPLADIVGSFSFPAFVWSGVVKSGLLKLPYTNEWNVGLSARAYIPI